MASNYFWGYSSLLALFLCQISAFSLYPTVDPERLAAALKISVGCLDALNTTVACDDSLFQWTVTVDDHFWSLENLTTLCTSTCTASARNWEADVALACANDDLTIYGKSVPAYTVAGRFADGLGIACLRSTTSAWCMIESLNWVGSDVIRPDCSVNPTDPSCSDPSNVTTQNQRIANLYNDTLLCSDCFMKMFYQRLSSDYLPDSDYSEYLINQFQDMEDVCSTRVGNLSTRAFYPFPAATIFVANVTTTLAISTGTTATPTKTGCSTTKSSVLTPTPRQTGMASNCNDFYRAVSGDSCYTIATSHNITLINFETWNPAVGANCTGLFAGYIYCIGKVLDTTSSCCRMVNTSAGVTELNATLACDQLSLAWGVTTGDLIRYTGGQDCYSPNAVCLPPACNLIRVPSNATCSIVSNLASNSTIGNITTTQLLSWNPNIIGTCDNLLAGQYICSGAPGGSYVPLPNPSGSAKAGGQERGGPGGTDPTAAPTPTQVGIVVSNCNQYAQAQSGDYCTKFAAAHKITPDQLYQWNTVLGAGGANCNTLFFAGYYYCIGVGGSKPASTTRTTTAPPISTSTPITPSPTQSGIVPNCNLFAQAVSGDYCLKFAAENSITTTELYAWNSVLGDNGVNCNTNFFAGYYYCVGVRGPGSPTATSSSAPSPTQAGIVSNCNGFAQAAKGDYCYEFAANHGITTTELYDWNAVLGRNGANCGTEFFAGYYYCISITS